MIELRMVRRMMLRGLQLAPLVVAGLWLFGSPRWALSGAIGLAMAVGNLWFAARIIGGVAENNPPLLLVSALSAFGLGLAALTGIAFALKAADVVFFPVTGLTLIGAHFVLVLWEAASAYARIDPNETVPGQAADLRS